MPDSPVHECPLDASNGHLSLGRNIRGEGPSAYEPHTHPFAFGMPTGLVACCTRANDCRIEGHITLADDGYRHASTEAAMSR